MGEPNQEFVKFLSAQGSKKNLPNLELLLNLDKEYPGMFIKAMTSFDEVEKCRKSMNEENGKIKKISWEQALKKFYFENRFNNVTEENIDIAQLFQKMGLSQKVFDEASDLRKIAKKNNVPEQVLGKTIKEETIIESIERIKQQTEGELIEAKQMIEELYDKQFTYEWLNKNDPRNSIMGILCDCCGSIVSQCYGRDIAQSSVIAADVQNLVIKDSRGEIVSKGTTYINKDRGYAVINDFELNRQFRNHELGAGVYDVQETSQDEHTREMIFKAFQRGLRAFIEEYNRQNPNAPLNQINVGMGYNRLKRQVRRFKKATSNLTVPSEYNFQDAGEEQYILYQREQEQIDKGGSDR